MRYISLLLLLSLLRGLRRAVSVVVSVQVRPGTHPRQLSK